VLWSGAIVDIQSLQSKMINQQFQSDTEKVFFLSELELLQFTSSFHFPSSTIMREILHKQAQVCGPWKLPGSVRRNTCKVLLTYWDFTFIKILVIYEKITKVYI